MLLLSLLVLFFSYRVIVNVVPSLGFGIGNKKGQERFAFINVFETMSFY